MPADLIKYAFVAGELSPAFFGRTDLTKYDMAMAEAYNLFVDYRGGLSSRPGFEFVDYLPDYVEGLRTLELIEPPLFFNFTFDPDVEFNLLGLIYPRNNGGTTFDRSEIRFIQNGAYVTEAAKTVTGITLANPAVISCASHGFAQGDWVTFNYSLVLNPEWRGRTVEVEYVNAGTFRVRSLTDGTLIDSRAFSAFVAGLTVSRVLTLPCDYEPADYKNLCIKQYRDLIRITHANYPPRNLLRSNTSGTVEDALGNWWELVNEVIGTNKIGPTISSYTSSAIPDGGKPADVLFAVSAVYADGTESLRGPIKHISGIVNYPATEGSVSINWAVDADAVYYNVYRSIVSVSETLSSGTELGFIGQVKGTKFTDPNIIPDFTRTPPQRVNPFAPTPIATVKITAGGTGHTDFSTTVGASGTGTGFSGEAIVQSGAVVGVNIRDHGTGYAVGDDQAGIITFSGGAGATATCTVSATIGTYPSQSIVYQQRQLYAASHDLPTTIWGSQVKIFNSFDMTSNLVDNDSYEFTLDTPSFAPIRHLVPTQGGLLVMTQESIWVLNGGSGGESITPTAALAVPQTYNGVGLVRPIKIGSELLYTEGKGNAIRLLSYNEISRVYSGDDRSILSSHLFTQDKAITTWAYQEEPYKIVWCAKSDGELNAFTVVKSEEIYAWTPCGTRGQFLSVANMRENNSYTSDVQIVNDRVYVVTQRYLQGRWRRMIERMALRNFVNVEDAFAVDCGLSLPATYRAGNLDVWKEAGNWFASTSTGSFSGVAAGTILRACAGIWRVNSVIGGGQSLTLALLQTPSQLLHETNELDDDAADVRCQPVNSNQWSLDVPVSTLTGLWHLEGEVVSILADGSVFVQETVVNGSITLPTSVTRFHAGLPFTVRAKTLPLTTPNAVTEGRRKIVNALAIRLAKTRGLQVGRALDELYSMRERINEVPGLPTQLINGVHHQIISTNWDENGQTYFVQTDPLPVTLLSVVTEVEVGDDPD